MNACQENSVHRMKALEKKIINEGTVSGGDVLRVDCFLNHQVDVRFLNEIGKEFHRLFGDDGITKILTIEASGIGIACITAQYFDCPVVFAKKSKTLNQSGEIYSRTAHSYTHGHDNVVTVSKNYLSDADRILIIDDFLANGSALNALIGIAEDAGAEIVGAGIVIEKKYQGGGDALRERGVRVESLARISSMDEKNGIVFC